LQVAGTSPAFEAAVRRTLAEIDPGLTLLRLTTLDGQVSGNFNSPRLVAQLTTLYGLVALALASVGLYGVASYTVARRTREIGVRIALGAQRRALMALVLRGTLRPIGLGLAIGLPAVVAAGRAISAQLYGVRSYDPVILAGAVAALGLAAVSAALVPARRAASIDPIRALRTD
jgi:ABC-type antimicrobial peptide transport system permease subunit